MYCYPGEYGRAIGLSPVNLMDGEDEVIVRHGSEKLASSIVTG